MAMIADEIDGAGPAKVVSQGAWLNLVGGLGFAFQMMAVVIAWAMAWAIAWAFGPWRVNPLRNLPAALVMPSYGLGVLAADRLLRWRGLSRGGTTVAVWARTGTDHVGGDDVVEVPLAPAGTFLQFGLIYGLIVSIVAVSLAVDWIKQGREPLEGVGWILAPLLAVAAVQSGCALVLWSGRPTVRVDRLGVAGYPAGLFAVRRRFVPWASVATVAIETRHDTFGMPLWVRPVCRAADGRRLLVLDFKWMPVVDRDRIIQAILGHYPKPVLDDWRDGMAEAQT